MAKLITIVLGVLCFYCSRAQIDSLQTTDTLIRRDSVIRADTLVTVTESLPLTPSALDRDKKRVYKLKPAIDVPLTAAGSAWTLYAFSVIYGRDPSPVEKIQSLDINSINRFDRWVADIYSEKAAETSDLFFYGSMPLPVLLMLDKKILKVRDHCL